MANARLADPSSDLPATIGDPARNTLAVAGITRLDQLPDRTGAETLALHGMGPKALSLLRDALAARGKALKVAMDER